MTILPQVFCMVSCNEKILYNAMEYQFFQFDVSLLKCKVITMFFIDILLVSKDFSFSTTSTLILFLYCPHKLFFIIKIFFLDVRLKCKIGIQSCKTFRNCRKSLHEDTSHLIFLIMGKSYNGSWCKLCVRKLFLIKSQP